MKFKKLNFVLVLQWFIVIVSAFYNFNLFAGSKLWGNAASRVLLAVGPQLGIGSPYKDLYELVPPGYLVFIASWVRLFGLSMISMRLIQVLLVVLNGFFLIKVGEKLFKNRWLQLFVFFSIIMTVHSRIIQTDYFSIDFFATTLVLGGLATLLNIKNRFIKIPLAATLFVLASQIKDIYIFSLISLFPYYWQALQKPQKKQTFKLIVLSLIGPLVIAIVELIYLSAVDSLPAYLDILINDKIGFGRNFSLKAIIRAYFTMLMEVEETFLTTNYVIFGLIITNLTLVFKLFEKPLAKAKPYQWRSPYLKKQTLKLLKKQLREYGKTELGKTLLTGLLIISTFYGLALYGLYYGTQLSMIITGYYLVVGILLILPLQFIGALKVRWQKIGLLLLLFAIFLPKKAVFYYQFRPVIRYYPFEIEKAIMVRVDKNDCILHVHGWEVAISYIYSQRRPCSRYFLANELFNIKRGGVIETYRRDLLNNPPAALLYNELGSDLDIEKFNNQVIDFPRILKHCYEPDPNFTDYLKHFFAKMTLYWPKPTLTKDQLKNCWAENSVLSSGKNL